MLKKFTITLILNEEGIEYACYIGHLWKHSEIGNSCNLICVQLLTATRRIPVIVCQTTLSNLLYIEVIHCSFRILISRSAWSAPLSSSQLSLMNTFFGHSSSGNVIKYSTHFKHLQSTDHYCLSSFYSRHTSFLDNPAVLDILALLLLTIQLIVFLSNVMFILLTPKTKRSPPLLFCFYFYFS